MRYANPLRSKAYCYLLFLLLSTPSFSQLPTRLPPQPSSSQLFPHQWLSDQSPYVNLGDNSGSVIALGDFNCDRYTDLLMVSQSNHMRVVHILIWNHHNFSFQSSSYSHLSSFSPTFSLHAVPNLSSKAIIAGAAAFDFNSDGYLDVLLSVQVLGRSYMGVVLEGDGAGAMRFQQILPDVNPGMLVMDANDDMAPDIFFVSSLGHRVFYLNDKLGTFRRKVWQPGDDLAHCKPTMPYNSNAFVDVNGDCLPDLIVTTTCGMEVWFNYGLQKKTASRWIAGKHFRKARADFSELSLESDRQGNSLFILLDSSVWDYASGDGRAVFADFNGDGTTDIAVPNPNDEQIRISYNIQTTSNRKRELCSVSPEWHFETQIALQHVRVSDSLFGPIRMQSTFRIGDFNFDSKLDILLIDGETGTLTLFEAQQPPDDTWFPVTGLHHIADSLLFPITGSHLFQDTSTVKSINYVRAQGSSILDQIEDPIAAVFFDLDESGRQDILVSQKHGSRLLWSSYKENEDAVFFKATSFETAHGGWRGSAPSMEAFSPLPGDTFQLSYGGRYGHETRVCSQCPQSGFFAMQTCSCLFGITTIANYIAEMATGGAEGVRTWRNLMPNALAVVWRPQESPRSFAKWRIAYLSRGRDGQMKRIAFVLFTTLLILLAAIAYTHYLERVEEARNKLDIGCT